MLLCRYYLTITPFSFFHSILDYIKIYTPVYSSPVKSVNIPLLCSGDGSGCEEGNPPAVQTEGQVLPRGRDWGADPGRHAAAFLPAGEGGHSVGGDLLSSRVCRAAGFLRCPGKVRRVRQVSAPIGLSVLWAPAAKEVSVNWSEKVWALQELVVYLSLQRSLNAAARHPAQHPVSTNCQTPAYLVDRKKW